MSRSSGRGCLIAVGLPSAVVAIYAGVAAVRLHSIAAPERLVLFYAARL